MIMGDRDNDEPNIPFHKNNIKSDMVSEETKSEEKLPVHTVSNIPWSHSGSKSFLDRSQAKTDWNISASGSVSLHQTSKVKANSTSSAEVIHANKTNIPVIKSNIPSRPNITSTTTYQDNISKDNIHVHPVGTREDGSTRALDEEEFLCDSRPKQDSECVSCSIGPVTSDYSEDSRDSEDIESENSNSNVRVQNSIEPSHSTLSKESECSSDGGVVVDGQSTSIIINGVDLQQFQDILQQTNDLQRRNEEFLHCVRQEDRTRYETLQHRLTETQSNFTSLENRIRDGDKEIKLIEEKIEPVVHKMDALCEKISSKQNVFVFRRNTTNMTTHSKKETPLNEKERDKTTNRTNAHKDGSRRKKEEESRVRRSRRSKDRHQMKHDTGSVRCSSSRHEKEKASSQSNITNDNWCQDYESFNNTSMSENGQLETGHVHDESRLRLEGTNHQNSVHSSEKHESTNSRLQQENDRIKAENDNISQRNEAHQSDHQHRGFSDGSPSRSGDRERRSKSKETLKSHVGDEKSPKLRQRRLKRSELGFKYRLTNPRVDNRVKVIGRDVTLRGGSQIHITDSNVKLPSPRRAPPSTAGASYESPGHFFDVPDDDDVLSVQENLSAIGISAEHVTNFTEADIEASKTWVAKANDERRRGTALAPFRGKGPDTVLILDTSESMRGQAFNDMIWAAKEIIRGIQGVHANLGVEENISIAVFGQETTVLRHLTMDYVNLITALDSLRVGGPSPYSAGLIMGLAALLGNTSGMTSVNDVALMPKAILISDGHATLDTATSDSLSRESAVSTAQVSLLLLPVLKDYATRGYRIFCVPVGNANMVHFKDICRVTKGRICYPNETHRLVKMTQAMVSAIQMNDALKGNNRKQMLAILAAGAMDNPMFHLAAEKDAEDIVDYIEYLRSKEGSAAGVDLPMHREQDPNMPPIGTRVRRGPSWKWTNQDTEGPGTVIGHQKNGMLWVEWDNGIKNRYHYMPGCYDVRVVEEPRQIVTDQLVATGYLVKRGLDWSNGGQDGGEGNIGVVFMVKENGTVGKIDKVKQ
ncbi:uncharacterized protein [Argopecten irradians]|uniref:uncharacterized protein isoform X2 n=1 Tax=Argopecten irradians TaxID=31199 RepID=UPI00371DD5E4